MTPMTIQDNESPLVRWLDSAIGGTGLDLGAVATLGSADMFEGGPARGWLRGNSPYTFTFKGGVWRTGNGVSWKPGWCHGHAVQRLLAELGLNRLVRYEPDGDRKQGAFTGQSGFQYIDQFLYKYFFHLGKTGRPETSVQKALADVQRLNGGTLEGTGLSRFQHAQ